MKIGLAQIDIAWEDKEKNKLKCIEYIAKAKKQGVDFLVFPEMTLTGFSMNVNKIGEQDNETVKWFGGKAKEYGLYIGFGYVQTAGDKGENRFSIVSLSGEEICNYTKIHPFSFGEESKHYQGGTQINLTEIAGFKAAPFVCYDLRFPEVFQVASSEASLIVVIANWPKSRKEHWIALLKARAIENQCYIAGINRVGKGNGVDYSGDSMIIDPLGNIITEAHDVEELLIASLQVEEVIKLRENFKLKEDRKERLYAASYQTREQDTYFSKLSLRGKNIIVTGACGLIGKEICKGIAEFGGNIIIADINQTVAEDAASKLREKYNIRTMAVPLDITSEESVDNMLKQIREDIGPVWGLVNSAYPRNKAYGAKYENIQLADWRENVDMHLNGYFNVTQKVSKVMIEQTFGNIVNIASIYGVLGPDFSIYEGTAMTMPGEYAVIKGGLVNFTRYLATYLAKHNVRVNCVSPGGIFDNQEQAFVGKYNNKTPMGRMGKPDEVVGAIIYLLSDLSSFVTGHNMMVDGGWSAW